MNYSALFTWMGRKLNITKRLKETTILYVLFLMVSNRKHSLEAVAAFSNKCKSRFSKFLQNHSNLAVVKLNELSKRQAKQFGKNIRFIADGKLPWKIAILIDATLQGRSSLHSDNVKRFNHGKGFVIGHQWTNIVLFVNDVLIPLPPIAFYTRSYCKEHNLTYKTEHEHVIEYIENLNIRDYVCAHKPHEVVVLADSGYDNKKIENAIDRKGWQFVIALKKKRSVKTARQYATTAKSQDWYQVEQLFKNCRRVKWITVYFFKNSPRKKRMDFRIRQIIGYLRYVGKAQLVCSEFKKRPKGRRKYLACNNLKAKPRQILLAYRIRWEIEIFHKMIKMFQGFEDVAPKYFESVISHVHWVYCAYILLNSRPPGMPANVKSIREKQKYVEQAVRNKQYSHYLQILSRFNGAEQLKTELRTVLEGPLELQTTI
jgi:hypothetical protein